MGSERPPLTPNPTVEDWALTTAGVRMSTATVANFERRFMVFSTGCTGSRLRRTAYYSGKALTPDTKYSVSPKHDVGT